MSALNAEIEKRKKFIPAKIVKNQNEFDFIIKLLDKPVRVRTQSETMIEQTLVTSQTRNEPGRYAPKRYVTTCYFQPKANPVSYSETVILTLGSSKKHYFETVLYQTKLIPFRWTESMTTLTPAAEGAFQAQHEAFIEEPKFHYMSLEPQQIAAVEKLRASEEVAV